ncbi:hypothetical protein F7D01_13645 [Erythrobacter sp. 3-20A1M]|uniref:hypothetical protein n=1 Tax=Erythrobacter sp. 3-20A1M TaxID=2653850 RepID=UPI001BFBFF59|nr:hypothetical protein [Erythrobacter sp. 3-20A1M]QWC57966.1 hypothetical protein F7D01_13645 [Erythrobacter sp. 3-20A1M]
MLTDAVDEMLYTPVAPVFQQAAMRVADECGADAVLFYGSSLRTGDREGVADFYALIDDQTGRRASWRWPIVSYHEFPIAGECIRAKVARLTLAEFARAATGASTDTTIWTRFCQPARLPFTRDDAVANRVRVAIADSILTASRFAAALGPRTGTSSTYWLSLFQETYGAEFRVETKSRAHIVVANEPHHFARMLPLAWQRLGLIDVVPPEEDAELEPEMSDTMRRHWLRRWRTRKKLGKPLNIIRLFRAAFTFEGATRYALWKIERHSGVRIAATPWRERHPVLAAPGVLFQLWRRKRS